jgi:outer membrane protein, multidrug efflux system
VAWRAPADNAAAWPKPDRWRGFRSPELDDLIAAAEAENFDIQAAIARVRQADAQVRISGAPLLPSVTGNASETWQRASLTRRSASAGFPTRAGAGSGYFETRDYGLNAGVSYEIDFWGRLRALRDSAVASAMFSRFDQQTVVLTAVTGVASAWFQALAFQDQLDVAARNLNDAEQILRAIRARREAGTASELDVAQQQALVAGIRAQIPALRSQLEQQLNGLGILTGKMPEAITVRPGTLTALALPPVSPGLPSDLLARRPDVAAAEAQLIAANANIRAARAAFFPQIALTGSGGWQSLALGTLFGPGSLLASAAGSAAQTIFDNGLKGGQYQQNKARYDELLADYRKAVVQAFTDVENALTAYRFATEQEALEQEAVATAQRAADIARAQVLAGTSDIVTALQAQTTLFTDLNTLAQVRLARFQALLNLYKALGGGWSQSDIEALRPGLFQGVL